MRIDAINTSAVSQIVGESSTNVVRGKHAVVPQASISEDRATLSADQDTLSSLVSTAMQSLQIRQDKVASLQQAIRSGEYQLDPAKIAASMIDEHA